MMKKWLLLKNIPISRLECKNHTLFITKMTKISLNRYPIYDQNGWKTIPFGAAHTYIAHIREYPPSGILVNLLNRCQSFHLQVDSPTSKLFRLHNQSHFTHNPSQFAYVKSRAPVSEGPSSRVPYPCRKENKTHVLIFSWLSWLAVLLMGTYAQHDNDDRVAQDGGHTPANRLTETCTRPSLTLDTHVMVQWDLSKQGIHWPVSCDHIVGSSLEFIEVTCFFFKVDRWPSAGFWLVRRLMSG